MVRFILLAHGRCGSSLITESLARHPEVRVGGELFHCEEEPRRRAFRPLNGTESATHHESRHYRSGTNAARFLEHDVFHERPGIRAVGFKMFYVHARSNANEREAWNYLLTNNDIRVIHLIRTNMLESYISLRVASITGEWERPRDSSAPRVEAPTLELEPKVCEAHFNQELAWRQWGRESFRHHPFLEIEYDKDVCTRFQAVMNEIQDFLDIARLPASQLLEKQSRRSTREAIINFDELKNYFQHTLYEEFFV